MTPLSLALLLSAFMFCTGVAGVLVKRNALAMLMSTELILNGANVAFVAFARELGNVDGHVFAVIVMTVAACEGAVGLALIVNLFRLRRDISLDQINELKG